jgi:hypothetical protein
MKTGDIINYNSQLYISQDFILANTGVSYGYLRKAKCLANKGAKSWIHQDILNCCYFVYGNLPVTAQSKLLPLAELIEYAKETNDDTKVIIDAAQQSSYKKFLSKLRKQDIATSAAILHEASLYISMNNANQ